MQEDIEMCLWRAQTGDQEATAWLCVQYAPLVRSIAARYRGLYQDHDDLVQIGFLRLLESIRTFDPTRGVYFGYYAKRNIHAGMWTSVRRQRREKERRQAARDAEAAETLLLELTDPSACEAFGLPEWADGLAALTDRERLAIVYTVLLGYTTSELADVCGVGRETVKTWRKRGLQKLSKRYQGLKL